MMINKGKIDHIGKKDLSDKLDKTTVDITDKKNPGVKPQEDKNLKGKKSEEKKPEVKKIDPAKFRKAWDELENKLGFNKDTKLEEDMTKRNNPYVFEKDYEEFNTRLGFKIKNKLKKIGRGSEYSNNKNKKPLDGYEKLDHYDKKLTEDGEGGGAPVGDIGGGDVAAPSGGKMTLYNTGSSDNIGKSVDADGNPIYNSALVYKHQGLYSRGRGVKVPGGQKVKRIRIFKRKKSKKSRMVESPFYDLGYDESKPMTIDLFIATLYASSVTSWIAALDKESKTVGFINANEMMHYIIDNNPDVYNLFIKILTNKYSSNTLFQLKREDVRKFINHFDIKVRKKLYDDVNDVWKFSKIKRYL